MRRKTMFIRRSAATALASLLAMTAACPAWAGAPAADADVRSADSLHAGQLDVPLNKSQMLTLDLAFARVMVGNEEIADIMPVSSRSIYVLGRKLGTTSLSIFDKANRLISVVDVAVGPDVVSLRRQMAELMPGENLGASISNDAIVLRGIASSAPVVDRAVQLAKTYAGDKVVNMISVGTSQQVMLEVRFAEVSRQAAKDLGFNHSFLNNKTIGSVGSAAPQSVLLTQDNGYPTVAVTSIQDKFGVLGRAFSIGSLNVFSTLDALESKGLIKTLAQPTLIALSGQTASFLAGGEFPIPVAQDGGGSDSSTRITVEFKPFGVSLGFTPTVLADGVINLAVEPEVSSLDPSASVQINGLTIPGLRTRRANTVLELRDGEAFAMAGLIQNDYSTTIRQLPILGSIPVIGTLFRSTGFQKGETELVIVVVPHLVKPTKPDNISLPTDRVGNPSESELFLLGRTDKAVPVIQGEAAQPASPSPASSGATKGANGYEY